MALVFGVPDTELTSTLHNRRDDLVDNIYKGTALLAAMRRFGGIIEEDGGVEIVQPLRYAKNQTATSFTDYDIIDTTPQDLWTSARYPWASVVVTVSISWQEGLKNQGRGRLIPLLQGKIDDAEMAARDKLNGYLLATAPAAGSDDPISLQEFVQNDPTSAPARVASIGNISGATYSWWRNIQLNGGAFSLADMHATWNDVSDGMDPPTFLLWTSTIEEYYESVTVGTVRHTDTRLADMGFQNHVYKTAPCVWDANSSWTDRIYYINTKYTKLFVHPQGNWSMGEFIEPVNQAATTAKIKWMGNLMCTNRRRLGVNHTITAPA